MPQTPYQFFKNHAGFSYNPKTETPEDGRRKTARLLADAEAAAASAGVEFVWCEDDQLFECACDDPACESHTPHVAFVCQARYEGRIFASLGGISFGPDGSPHGEPYTRVVEAELALQFEPPLDRHAIVSRAISVLRRESDDPDERAELIADLRLVLETLV